MGEAAVLLLTGLLLAALRLFAAERKDSLEETHLLMDAKVVAEVVKWAVGVVSWVAVVVRVVNRARQTPEVEHDTNSASIITRFREKPRGNPDLAAEVVQDILDVDLNDVSIV